MSEPSKQIIVKDIAVNFVSKNNNDYISLTDIAKYKDRERSDQVVQNWLRTRSVIEYIGLWEQLNNSNFKPIEFEGFKNESGSNAFVLTPQKWIKSTNAIGLISKSGRYGGGTYAHRDIAFEFASWISAEFKLYLIKEFQRLKIEENERLSTGWSVKRILTKANYKIHTDAVKEYLIPLQLSKESINFVYASEADVLNMALFGMTAQQWREDNKNSKGNIRDQSTVEQLIVLSNLESLNAEYIRQGILQNARLKQLNEIAIYQIKSLIGNGSVKKLGVNK